MRPVYPWESPGMPAYNVPDYPWLWQSATTGAIPSMPAPKKPAQPEEKDHQRLQMLRLIETMNALEERQRQLIESLRSPKEERPMSLLDKFTRDEDAQRGIVVGLAVALTIAVAGFTIWVARGFPINQEAAVSVLTPRSSSSQLEESSTSSPNEAAASFSVVAPEPTHVVRSADGPIATDTPVERLERNEFDTPLLMARMKAHRNGPWVLIPKNASTDELRTFAIQAEAIIQYHQEVQDALSASWGGDVLAFSNDPRVRQNDRDRQDKLMNALKSLWPKVKVP